MLNETIDSNLTSTPTPYALTTTDAGITSTPPGTTPMAAPEPDTSIWSVIMTFLSSTVPGPDVPMWLVFAVCGGIILGVIFSWLVHRYFHKDRHMRIQEKRTKGGHETEKLLHNKKIDIKDIEAVSESENIDSDYT
jgi:hypothetical protein